MKSKLETPSQEIAELKTLAMSKASQYSSILVAETEALSHGTCSWIANYHGSGKHYYFIIIFN